MLVSLSASLGLGVTFHRAFDLCGDLPRALEDLVDCGVHRVLTSGGHADAVRGSQVIKELVQLAERLTNATRRKDGDKGDAIDKDANGDPNGDSNGDDKVGKDVVDNVPGVFCHAKSKVPAIIIMAGAGITADNAVVVVRETGVREVHGSMKKIVETKFAAAAAATTTTRSETTSETTSETLARMPRSLSLGKDGADDWTWWTADEEQIRTIKAQLRSLE